MLLAALHAERILDEPLAARVAEIKPQRTRRLVNKIRRIAAIESLEQILHVFQVVRIGRELIGILASTLLIFDGGKYLDLDDMTHVVEDRAEQYIID